MKTVRMAIFEGEQMFEVVSEDNIGRSTVVGWVTEDDNIFFCSSRLLPKYDPYTGEPLSIVNKDDDDDNVTDEDIEEFEADEEDWAMRLDDNDYGDDEEDK